MGSPESSRASPPRGAIVCVDDERNFRELLADQLRELFGSSHDIGAARSAEDALGLLFKFQKEGRSLDLVLSDARMTGMPGDRFLEIVHDRFPGVRKIMMVSGTSDMDLVLYALNNAQLDKYIQKPWSRDDLQFVVGALLKELDLSRANVRLLGELKHKNQALEAALRDLKDAQGELERSYLHTIQSLALALEAKDHYTAGHSERVCRFSVLLARQLELTEHDIETVKHSALMHDIGKIGMSEKILRKEGGLSAAEFELMKQHPCTGAQILSPVRAFSRYVPGVRHHHERYDGKGYPDGISGEDIPVSARIILIADTFDAITSDRSYRRARTVSYAVKQFEANAGTQFDPKMVKAFMNLLRDRKIYREAEPPHAPEGEPVPAGPATESNDVD
jgi:response regulator RpfG family c-di-GMP phosphodiesterase